MLNQIPLAKLIQAGVRLCIAKVLITRTITNAKLLGITVTREVYQNKVLLYI
jgi:hypothetical protein